MNQQPKRLLKKSRKSTTERLSTGSRDNVDEDGWISTYPKSKIQIVNSTKKSKSKSSLLINVNESDLSDSDDDSLPLGSSSARKQKKAKPSKFSKKLNGNNKKSYDCSSSDSSDNDESVTEVKKKSLLEYSKKNPTMPTATKKKQPTNTNITTKQSKVQVTTKPKGSKQQQAVVAKAKEKKHTKISRTSINKISTAGVRTAPVSDAQNKANQVPISEDITSISQLQWYKKILSHNTEHDEFSNKESLQPCRILSTNEAMKYRQQQQMKNNNDNNEKTIVIQYIQYPNIHKGTYKIVNTNLLIPMGYKSKDGLSSTFNDDYMSRYINEQRHRSNSHALECERLYIHRVFNGAREMERVSRMKKEYDDYCNDDDDDDVSNSSSRSSGSGNSSSDDDDDDDDDIKVNNSKKTLRGRILDEESSRKARGRVQFEVELNNTDDEDDDDEDEFDDLEVPYTQAITFDPDDLVGEEEQSNEPIRPGDVIEYYSPIHVAGDPRGLRQATVLSVDPNDETPLVLSNGEGLPNNTKVKRIKVKSGNDVFDHSGIFRPIFRFRLKKGGNATAADGIASETARFGKIMQKNMGKAMEKASKDGFAPMDMVVNIKGATNKADDTFSKPPPAKTTKQPSAKKTSASLRSTKEHESLPSSSEGSQDDDDDSKSNSSSTSEDEIVSKLKSKKASNVRNTSTAKASNKENNGTDSVEKSQETKMSLGSLSSSHSLGSSLATSDDDSSIESHDPAKLGSKQKKPASTKTYDLSFSSDDDDKDGKKKVAKKIGKKKKKTAHASKAACSSNSINSKSPVEEEDSPNSFQLMSKKPAGKPIAASSSKRRLKIDCINPRYQDKGGSASPSLSDNRKQASARNASHQKKKPTSSPSSSSSSSDDADSSSSSCDSSKHRPAKRKQSKAIAKNTKSSILLSTKPTSKATTKDKSTKSSILLSTKRSADSDKAEIVSGNNKSKRKRPSPSISELLSSDDDSGDDAPSKPSRKQPPKSSATKRSKSNQEHDMSPPVANSKSANNLGWTRTKAGWTKIGTKSPGFGIRKV